MRRGLRSGSRKAPQTRTEETPVGRGRGKRRRSSGLAKGLIKQVNDDYEAMFGSRLQKLTGARASSYTIDIMRQAIREKNPWPKRQQLLRGAKMGLIKQSRKAYKFRGRGQQVGTQIYRMLLFKQNRNWKKAN